jgi:hypothetical protein
VRVSRQPTMILLVGLLAAGLAWGIGTLNTHRLAHVESELKAQCEFQNATKRAEVARQADRSLVNASDAELAALAKQKSTSLSELTAMRDEQRTAQSIEDLPVPLEWQITHDELICDVGELQGPKFVGLQATMVSAHRATLGSSQWPVPLALILLSVGSVPWFWYFLLRRIAELRSAIGGKPPI